MRLLADCVFVCFLYGRLMCLFVYVNCMYIVLLFVCLCLSVCFTYCLFLLPFGE